MFLALFIGSGRRVQAAIVATRRWSVTVIATAVSTYLLDAVATVAGVALVASNLLASVTIASASLILASTYVVWGVGLNRNLRANWMLLESTGTSTNILSKAAYDLLATKERSHVRKFFTDAGYVATELVKETPYYAGAFGIAAMSDAVSLREAIVFLSGANLGAALYEYFLAWGTKAYLSAVERYGDFEPDWTPEAYLTAYYSAVEEDERHTIAFFVDHMKATQHTDAVLFFGVGPTLHHVFLANEKADEIHLADFLPANLREIEKWINARKDAHDWHEFVALTLECEGATVPSEVEIRRREQSIRSKITKVLQVDIRSPEPLGAASNRKYTTVISAYCVDSIASDREVWLLYMDRLAAMVRPGGSLMVAALRRTDRYYVAGKSFPSPSIDEHDINKAMLGYFAPEDITVCGQPVPQCAAHGYKGIVLACGHHRFTDRFSEDISQSPA